jgi:DNA adenine methylase
MLDRRKKTIAESDRAHDPWGYKGLRGTYGGGGGWLLFFKEKWAPVEVYNDIDGRLVNLFRVIKYHPEALYLELKFMLSSRELFKQLLTQEGLTDIQMGARFLYLVKRSFGAKGRHFGVSKTSGGHGHSSYQNMLARMEALHSRLDNVVIENKDFEEIVGIYDAKKTFFYFDPPYFKGGEYYECAPFDHERHRACMKKIKGRWIMSIDDCERAVNLFGRWKTKGVSRQKGIENRRGSKVFKELLIRNF